MGRNPKVLTDKDRATVRSWFISGGTKKGAAALLGWSESTWYDKEKVYPELIEFYEQGQVLYVETLKVSQHKMAVSGKGEFARKAAVDLLWKHRHAAREKEKRYAIDLSVESMRTVGFKLLDIPTAAGLMRMPVADLVAKMREDTDLQIAYDEGRANRLQDSAELLEKAILSGDTARIEGYKTLLQYGSSGTFGRTSQDRNDGLGDKEWSEVENR